MPAWPKRCVNTPSRSISSVHGTPFTPYVAMTPPPGLSAPRLPSSATRNGTSPFGHERFRITAHFSYPSASVSAIGEWIAITTNSSLYCCWIGKSSGISWMQIEHAYD
jgi:hypothetical protein